nr:MAG: ORF1 [Torque teno midi virus]
MPFWWRRRRRYWWGRYRNKRRARWPKRRRRRPRYRRKTRRFTRRGRRKRRKVRRKRKAINIKQWQPESIVNCKIKGYTATIVGAQGRQMFCYTAHKTESVAPKTPYGGGFAYDVFSLKYLFEEWVFHNNIWTASNLLKELCRYLRVRMTFYRDPKTDFIIAFDIQPPFNLTKWTYPALHPHQMLLQKHKIILLSKSHNPKGKLYKRISVRPPKQMINKWFFSSSFSPYPLIAIKATSCNLQYSFIGCCNENPQVGFYYINHGFFQNANWGQATTSYYLPRDNLAIPQTYKDDKGTFNVPDTTHQNDFTGTSPQYYLSVSYEYGWFNKRATHSKVYIGTVEAGIQPFNVAFYNPYLDKGDQNEIYLTSILTKTWDPPKTDTSLYLSGLPLWMGLYGFVSYVKQIKEKENVLDEYVLVIRSPAIFPYSQIGAGNFYMPISQNFMDGYGPSKQPPTAKMKRLWYPTLRHQIDILNIFVTAGPYIQKYNDQKESNWELKSKYCFYFKWGGSYHTEKEVQDPTKQDTYDVPDKFTSAIQITNPEIQTTETIIHPWDYRRGYIKESAIKRMCENFSVDSDISTDAEEPQKKKPKREGPQLCIPGQKDPETQRCLRYLFEESTCQDPKTQEEMQALILQQQHQQLELKRNLLHLLTELKQQQKMLQLQTGMLP